MRDKNGRFLAGISSIYGCRPREVGHVHELACDLADETIETLVDLMRHAKFEATHGTAARTLLYRGYGMSVAVSMDVVDEGETHLM